MLPLLSAGCLRVLRHRPRRLHLVQGAEEGDEEEQDGADQGRDQRHDEGGRHGRRRKGQLRGVRVHDDAEIRFLNYTMPESQFLKERCLVTLTVSVLSYAVTSMET